LRAIPFGNVLSSDEFGAVPLLLQALDKVMDVRIQVLLIFLNAPLVHPGGGFLLDVAPALLQKVPVQQPIEVAAPIPLLTCRLLGYSLQVGTILSLVLVYEIQAMERLPRVQDVVSSCRLVQWAKASAGKRYGPSGATSGHTSLMWAFSEAAGRLRRDHPAGQKAVPRLEKKQGQGHALTLLPSSWGVLSPTGSNTQRPWIGLRFSRQSARSGGACQEGAAMRVALRPCPPRRISARTPEPSAVDGPPAPAPPPAAMVAPDEVCGPPPRLKHTGVRQTCSRPVDSDGRRGPLCCEVAAARASLPWPSLG
jgi:hypothetical protein